MSATDRDLDLLSHIEEAIRHADSLVGRAVSIVSDPDDDGDSPERLMDGRELARMGALLRSALLGARALLSSADEATAAE